jgi:hypothetical protein
VRVASRPFGPVPFEFVDRMTRLLRVAIFVCAAIAVSAATARANSIGPTCGTCQGSIYTLTNLGLMTDLYGADGTADTWRIMLTIDTSGYTGTSVRIDEVAVKVSSAVNAATLVNAPGGVSLWQLVPGGLNADGCSGSGSGFECSDWIVGSLGGAVIPGPLLKWVFDVDVSSPLFSGANQASIKARYVDTNNVKVGALVSENITLGTPVPEPATLGLLALGLSLVAVRRNRARV